MPIVLGHLLVLGLLLLGVQGAAVDGGLRLQFFAAQLVRGDLHENGFQRCQGLHVLTVVRIEAHHVFGGRAVVEIAVLFAVGGFVNGLEGVPNHVRGGFHADLQKFTVRVHQQGKGHGDQFGLGRGGHVVFDSTTLVLGGSCCCCRCCCGWWGQ